MQLSFDDFCARWENTGTETSPSMTVTIGDITLVIASKTKKSGNGTELAGMEVYKLNEFEKEPVELVRYECCIDHLIIHAQRRAYSYYDAITHVGHPNPNSPWAKGQ